MKYVWIVLLLLSLTFTSCQNAAPSTAGPQESVGQTDSPESPSGSSPTQPLSPALTQEETTMSPVTPPNESAEQMVSLVKQHLAQRLGIAMDKIVLLSVKPVAWRDAGLGCPKPAVDYIQVETPGYNILLEADGTTYTYHTDETKRFVQCNK